MKQIQPNPNLKKNISWYLEDELSGIEQAKKEDMQMLCKHLNLPFNREIAMALMYGDNKMLPQRILPYWFNELK